MVDLIAENNISICLIRFISWFVLVTGKDWVSFEKRGVPKGGLLLSYLRVRLLTVLNVLLALQTCAL